MNLAKRLSPYLLIFLCWILDFASKLKYNGLVYGFDFGLFHPDGSLYTFRTLTWLGHSQAQAGQMVSDWYSSHAFKLNHFQPSDLFFNVNPQWDRFLPRILYSLLSVPFVALFGINGMLVVPSISMLCLMISVYLLGKILHRPILGLAIAITFSITLTINRWMFINTTDSLLVGLTSLLVLVLAKEGLSRRRWWIYIISLVLLTSLTRVAILMWLGIAIVLLYKNQKLRAFFVTSLAVIAFIPAVYKNTSSAILPNESSTNLISKVALFPKSMLKVAFYEIAELAVLDRLLLILILIAVMVSLRNWRQASSQYFILTCISLWLTGAVNGTPGVNFRYQLPLLPFLAWTLIQNSPKVRTESV